MVRCVSSLLKVVSLICAIRGTCNPISAILLDENKETAFSAERSVLPRLLELLNSIDPKIHGEAVAVVGCLATHKNREI